MPSKNTAGRRGSVFIGRDQIKVQSAFTAEPSGGKDIGVYEEYRTDCASLSGN